MCTSSVKGAEDSAIRGFADSNGLRALHLSESGALGGRKAVRSREGEGGPCPSGWSTPLLGACASPPASGLQVFGRGEGQGLGCCAPWRRVSSAAGDKQERNKAELRRRNIISNPLR